MHTVKVRTDFHGLYVSYMTQYTPNCFFTMGIYDRISFKFSCDIIWNFWLNFWIIGQVINQSSVLGKMSLLIMIFSSIGWNLTTLTCIKELRRISLENAPHILLIHSVTFEWVKTCLLFLRIEIWNLKIIYPSITRS